MDSVELIRIIAGCVALCVLALAIVYIAFLGGVLWKCSPSSRTMQPRMVWLLLIPLFSLYWSFVVIFALSDSLANEFRLRNIPTSEPKPGKTIGTAMAVCGACSIIPFVNILTMPAHLVLWVIYWVKIANLSRRLDSTPVSVVASATP